MIKELKNGLLVLLMGILAVSCWYRNPMERNTIVFEDRLEDVRDSMVKIQVFFDKIPEREDVFNRLYEIKEGKLYLNSIYIVDSIDGITPRIADGDNAWVNFTADEKEIFNGLATYLNRNHISCAYLDNMSNFWQFCYRELPDEVFNDSRNIVLINNEKELSALRLRDTVLDQKGKLCLIAPKGAVIR